MSVAAPQKASGSYASRVSGGKDMVYDVRVRLNDEDRYFIVKIDPAKHQAFLQAMHKDQGLRLEDFGEILHRGWGEPSFEVQRKFNALYGMYPHAEAL